MSIVAAPAFTTTTTSQPSRRKHRVRPVVVIPSTNHTTAAINNRNQLMNKFGAGGPGASEYGEGMADPSYMAIDPDLLELDESSDYDFEMLDGPPTCLSPEAPIINGFYNAQAGPGPSTFQSHFNGGATINPQALMERAHSSGGAPVVKMEQGGSAGAQGSISPAQLMTGASGIKPKATTVKASSSSLLKPNGQRSGPAAAVAATKPRASASSSSQATPAAAASSSSSRPDATRRDSGSSAAAGPSFKASTSSSGKASAVGWSQVKTLLESDKLNSSENTTKVLPQLVKLIGRRRQPSGELAKDPEVQLSAKQAYAALQSLRRAPKRFIEALARNEEAVRGIVWIAKRSVTAMKDEEEDAVEWANTWENMIRFYEVFAPHMTLDQLEDTTIFAPIVKFKTQLLPKGMADGARETAKVRKNDFKSKMFDLVNEMMEKKKDVGKGGVKAEDGAGSKKRSRTEDADEGSSKKVKKESSPSKATNAKASSSTSAPAPKTRVVVPAKKANTDMSFFGAAPAPKAKAAPAKPDLLTSLFKQSQPSTVAAVAKVEDEYVPPEVKLPAEQKLGKNGLPKKVVTWRPEATLVAIREIEGRDESMLAGEGHARDLDREGAVLRHTSDSGEELEVEQDWYQPEFIPWAGGEDAQEEPEPAQADEHRERDSRLPKITYYEDDEQPPTANEEGVEIVRRSADTGTFLDLFKLIKTHPNSSIAYGDIDEDEFAPSAWDSKAAAPFAQAELAGYAPPVANLNALLQNLQPPPQPQAPAPPIDLSMLKSINLDGIAGIGKPNIQQPPPALYGQYAGSPSAPAYPQGYGAPPQAWNPGPSNGFGAYLQQSGSGYGAPPFASQQQQQQQPRGVNRDGRQKGMCKFEKKNGFCKNANCDWQHMSRR